MKHFVQQTRVWLLLCLGLCMSIVGYSQSETHDFITYDTIFKSGVDKWLIRISRPANMFTANHPDTASRPVIIMMPGQGESQLNGDGTRKDSAQLSAGAKTYGPHYWLNNGWDGGIQLGNGMHYPILITVVPDYINPRGPQLYAVMNHIINTYRIKKNSVHGTGLSMGAFSWGKGMAYEASAGAETFMKLIKSLCLLQGASAETFAPYNAWSRGMGAYGHAAKVYDFRFFGLEGTSDTRDVWKIRNNMRDSGYVGNAYFAWENIGGGGHCCWNTMYNPSRTNWNAVSPLGTNITTNSGAGKDNTQGTYKNGTNLFTWMLQQGDTSLVAAANTPPIVEAGVNRTIYIPQDSVHLSGSATDADGTIIAYQWTKQSGGSATITSSAAAATSVTGLAAGIYIFRLTATDDDAAAAYDSVIVTVLDTSSVVKKVNVNIYGGTNPYSNTAWNNWNITSGSTISNLTYEDGTNSGYGVAQTYYIGGAPYAMPCADNGASYGGTMCPPQVLRYASYTTVARVLTISGLDISKTYTLTFYASRSNTGNSTTFIAGGDTVNVVTDGNLTNAAVISGLSPDVSGNIAVFVGRGAGATYNYVNGFVIEEESGSSARGILSALIMHKDKVQATEEITAGKMEVYPNPGVDVFNLVMNNKQTGKVVVTISNTSGQAVKTFSLTKAAGQLSRQLSLQGLLPGTYLVKVSMQGYTATKQIVKF